MSDRVVCGPAELRCGDWRTVLADVGEVDAIVTDPPYGERTHAGQRTGTETRKTTIAYEPLTPELANELAGSWSPRVRHWAILFSDHQGQRWHEDAWLSVGWYVFSPVLWLKRCPTPRLAGDGPTNSCEYITVARPRRPVRGARSGSRPGDYRTEGNIPLSLVAGQKDIGGMRAIVCDYTLPGDLVVDPFAGSGSTLLAASIEGRRSIGAELDPETFAKAKRRLEGGYTPRLPFAESVA